jgi:hypothetical protein
MAGSREGMEAREWLVLSTLELTLNTYTNIRLETDVIKSF